jgi:hypothetical protein
MTARFLVDRSYVLPSRSLYVAEGTIVEGTVVPGMLLTIGLNNSLSMAWPIAGVEFVRRSESELVALTVLCEDADEVDFLQSFELSKEEIFISEPEETNS